MRITGTLDLDGSTVKLDQGGNATTLTSNSPSGDITLTLPSTADTLVGRATTDTLTNKTLTSPVLTTPQINDTSADHQYVFAVSELTADRTVTLPLLTGDDTFVFASHTQTLTNKTLTSPVLTTPTFTAGSNITLTQQAELRLEDDSGGEYVGLIAPSGVTTYSLSPPSVAPTANSQVLSITDYTASPVTSQWASALTSALTDQNIFIGDSTNTSTAVDTQLEGEIEAKVNTVTFLDADISTTNDTITVTSHGLYTGSRIYLTTTGTLPTGLSASTEYWTIKSDANTIKVATSLANAIAGTAVDITAASGGGTHTVHGGGANLKSSSLLQTPVISLPNIADSSDLTKDIAFTLSGATTAKTLTLISSHTDDRSITFPDATDTLVGKATTDTLTNKTLTAPDVTGGSYINMLTQAAIRFNDDAGGDYIALRAPTGVTTHTLNLPATQGSASTALTNDGSGNLSWASYVSTTLNDENVVIGNASNVATSVDTGIVGDISATIDSFDFVDGDISTTNDTITETSHPLATGQRVYLTTTGTLPTGLSASTAYYVIVSGANTIKLASSYANALNGTAIDITAASGGGTHTVNYGGLQDASADASSRIFIVSSTATTFSFDGGGGTSSSVTLRYKRVGDWVYLFLPVVTATSGTSSTYFTADTALDVFARPLTAAQGGPVFVKDNGAASTVMGQYTVSTAGIITVSKDFSESNWTNATSCGPSRDQTIVYYVGTGS